MNKKNEEEQNYNNGYNFWVSLTEKGKKARLQVISLWVCLMLACILIIIFIPNNYWKGGALGLLIGLVFFTGRDIRRWNGGK